MILLPHPYRSFAAGTGAARTDRVGQAGLWRYCGLSASGSWQRWPQPQKLLQIRCTAALAARRSNSSGSKLPPEAKKSR